MNGESPLDLNGFKVMLAVRKDILELIALLPPVHFNLSFGIGKMNDVKPIHNRRLYFTAVIEHNRTTHHNFISSVKAYELF